jgi:heme/copper-type cytochrome/quinol oxidase subunit 1
MTTPPLHILLLAFSTIILTFFCLFLIYFFNAASVFLEEFEGKLHWKTYKKLKSIQEKVGLSIIVLIIVCLLLCVLSTIETIEYLTP